VGETTAATVLAEVGEIERFDRDRELVSYAGLDPEVHQSGDTEVRGSISKAGSAPLRWTLVQSAHVAVQHDEYLGNFDTRLKQKKNHQIAIVATARKLLVSIFHMLTRKEPYDPPEVSAEAATYPQLVFAFPHSHSSAEDVFRLSAPDEAVVNCCLVVFSDFFNEFTLPKQLCSWAWIG
jgi:hypothetical protein